MDYERPKLIRKQHIINAVVYLALLIVLGGVTIWGWILYSRPFSGNGSVYLLGISGAALLVALLFGIPCLFRFLPERRRLLALCNTLKNISCPDCREPFDPISVEFSAFEAAPFCSGDPENEDLRARWMVQCPKCGAWNGFGDDGELIQGGVIPVPKHR
ncbi:MAG: hypothetical protein L6R28_02920 [Planctomycetes bacterium]|nr:hypothetical protein [Planctomycetota bacterium]